MSSDLPDSVGMDCPEAAQRVSVYIDGLNLYHGLRAKGYSRYLWTDLRSLSENLALADQAVCSVKYFTARFIHEGGTPGAIRHQDQHLQALDSVNNVQVVEGEFLRRMGRCRVCGEQWRTYEEKMTDVNLGIELISDAADDVFDVAIMISGDGDLTGPVEKVLTRYPAKRVVVAFPPNRSSKSLKNAASAYFSIGRNVLRDSQLPDVIHTRDGIQLRRPAEWR